MELQLAPVERRGLVWPRMRSGVRYAVLSLYIVLLVSAPLMRGLFFPGDLYPYLMGTGALLLFCAVYAAMRKDRPFSGFLPLAFLWLACAYGAAFFVAASPPEALRGFLRHLAYFGVFWIASYLSRTGTGGRAVIAAVFWGATLVALVGVLSATGAFVFPGGAADGQIMSTLQYPNALASYLMFSSVIGLTLLSVEENALAKTAISLATVLQTLVFLASYSRGGWLVYPVAVALMFLGMPGTQRGKLTFNVCATFTSVLLVVRRFTEAIESAAPRGALKYVAFGLAIAIFFEAVYALFGRVSLTLLSTPARRVLGWVGGLYAAATFAAYLVALAGQYSSGVGGMVSASMLRTFRTISADDPSLMTRAFANGDALKIWLRHPFLGGGAGAWNAWYHGVQRVLYWTTETHNHFAQVLVETGILGIAAYASIWVGLMACAVRTVLAWRQGKMADDPGRVALIWGLTAACIAVGIHSAMDFELSLPGIAVQLYAVFGVVHAWTLDAGQLPEADGERRSAGPRLSARLAGWPSRGLLAAAGLTLIALAFFMQKGGWYGSLGAVALGNQDYHTAVLLYDQAQRYDPLTASYAVDKAQSYAAMALLGGRADAKALAVSELKKAELQEPFNLACRLKEAEILTGLGELPGALRTWRDLVSMLPLDIRMYEGFARICVVSYMDSLRGAASAGQNRPPDAAEVWLSDVTALPDKLDALRAGITGRYKAARSPAKLEATPSLNTYIGQAYYLRGDLDRAIGFFRKALSGATKMPEAEAWLTASRVLAGQMPATDVSTEALHVMWYYRPTAE